MPTDEPGLLMATPRLVDLEQIRQAVDQITAYAREGDVQAALRILALLVPEFDHNPAGEVRALAPESAASGAMAAGVVHSGQAQADGNEQVAL